MYRLFVNTSNVILDVSGTPTVTPDSVLVEEGSEVTLTCTISTTAMDIIYWENKTRSLPYNRPIELDVN